MRTLKIFFLLFFCPVVASAQFENTEVGLHLAYAQFKDKNVESVGILVHIPVTERWTVNYNLAIGLTTQNRWYGHVPVAAVGGAAWLSGLSSSPEVGMIGFLLACIPEGVGYYISQGETMQAHLSVNPLGFEYFKRGDPYYEFGSMSGDVQLRLKFPFKERFYFAPQIGTRLLYRNGQAAFTAGFSLGLCPFILE